jgi:hypothetical protein
VLEQLVSRMNEIVMSFVAGAANVSDVEGSEEKVILH